LKRFVEGNQGSDMLLGTIFSRRTVLFETSGILSGLFETSEDLKPLKVSKPLKNHFKEAES